MIENKALWKRAFTTDPAHVKPITGKQYKGNSPKPYWIVERLTDEFGPCGIGWGFTILNERMERLTDTDTLHIAVVRFWFSLDGKRGEFEQIGQTKATYKTRDGALMVDEDAPKKSVTDALVKCASYLGFAGDIFSGMWDDSKYVAHAAAEWKGRAANGDVAHSGPAIAFAGLSPDWQAWITDLARDVENAFESSGPAAAQELIDQNRDQMQAEHIAALWSKLNSRTRSSIKALKQAA